MACEHYSRGDRPVRRGQESAWAYSFGRDEGLKYCAVCIFQLKHCCGDPGKLPIQVQVYPQCAGIDKAGFFPYYAFKVVVFAWCVCVVLFGGPVFCAVVCVRGRRSDVGGRMWEVECRNAGGRD